MKKGIPVFLAVLGAWAWLGQRAWPYRSGFPMGSDWFQYVYAAFALHDPSLFSAFPDWRSPLYPSLLGSDPVHWGPILSGLCMAVVIAEVAALAWLLGGRLAAVAAALAVPLLPMAVLGSVWINPYPLVAPLVGAALLCGAWAGQGATWGLWGLGLWGGLAWGVDARGVVGLVGGMVAALPLLLRGGWALSIRNLLIMLSLSFIGPLSATQLSVREALPTMAQVRFQRQLSLEELSRHGQNCASEPITISLPAMLTGRCGQTLRAYGLKDAQSDHNLPPWPLLCLGILGVLLPRPARAEGAWEGLGVFGVPAAYMVAGMSLVLWRDRYLLPLIVPLSTLLPLGLYRITTYLPVQIRLFSYIFLICILYYFFYPLESPRLLDGPSHHGSAAWTWLGARLQPEDRAKDCAALGLEALALPRRLSGLQVDVAGIDQQTCLAYAQAPGCVGTASCYLITTKESNFGSLRLVPSGWVEQAVFDAPTLPEEPRVIVWKHEADRLSPAP